MRARVLQVWKSFCNFAAGKEEEVLGRIRGLLSLQSKTIQGPRYLRKVGRFSTLLSKIGLGGIDNQWFRHAILTIVPRPSEDRSKIVSWCKEFKKFFPSLRFGRSAEPCKGFKEFKGVFPSLRFGRSAEPCKEFKGWEELIGTEKINVIWLSFWVKQLSRCWRLQHWCRVPNHGGKTRRM